MGVRGGYGRGDGEQGDDGDTGRVGGIGVEVLREGDVK